MALTAYSSRQTVQTGDIQNGPCGMVECASGKLLFLYTPSAAHAGSGSIAFRSASSEAAANAGTFSSATTISAEDATYYYGGCWGTRVLYGANAGRIWIVYTRADVATGKSWNTQLKYSDDEGATWSSGINVTGSDAGYSGSVGGYSGCGVTGPIVERPGTAGQEFIMPVLGWTTGGAMEHVRCVKSTDGGATWGSSTLISNSASISNGASEPFMTLIQRQNGAYRLLCGINHYPNAVATSYSDDWGATWSSMSDIVTSATAPPALIQVRDGTIQAMYRNLGSSENTWRISSTDYASSWSGAVVVDNANRMRYGQWANLRSGRVGLCYATESSSTSCAVYWQSFTVPPAARKRLGSGRRGPATWA